MKLANSPSHIPYPLVRRRFVALVSGGFLAAPLAAEAQQAGRVYRIGFLRAGRPPDGFVAGFKQGLQELGYVEGRNIIIE
jgi:putative tryptophan/tyrosine transport system substrate-binding protein